MIIPDRLSVITFLYLSHINQQVSRYATLDTLSKLRKIRRNNSNSNHRKSNRINK